MQDINDRIRKLELELELLKIEVKEKDYEPAEIQFPYYFMPCQPGCGCVRCNMWKRHPVIVTWTSDGTSAKDNLTMC